MGTLMDAILALFVLAVASFVFVFVLVDASLSVFAALVGGLGTIGFELLAYRDPQTVREYWERPVVQVGSVVLALGGVAAGAVVAPSSVLSFVLGSLVTYLGFYCAMVLWRR
ncbi:hypothetical protein [Natronorubrum daqingense]|uniref:Uncharacterized protein n=1 Tax=Natronorubrum daqingense TaxID=588898 RepID=A0A1N7A6D3_9EURY|nr:hypothetical protein [Natronorubrum daqingense]APX95129.1 hypothetical protein BB347_00125 [Natronorubrum daqingense]SIR34531.1 hypothetical protein SAMN05421809_1043 [Natronorubrum daqingense]